MPVTNTSTLLLSRSIAGGWRWIGHFSAVTTGPRASIGSPSTLNTRLRVSLPTGTESGPPVSSTSIPRTMPSVPPSATHRTRPPPRCCWTSPVTLTCRPLTWRSMRTAL